MTEKDYNPNQKENKAMDKQSKVATPTVAPRDKATDKKEDASMEVLSAEDKKKEAEIEKKAKSKVKEAPKKESAEVNARSIPVSTKVGAAICSFIRKKKIGDAIARLEKVAAMRKAVPMKGEIPHRKGKIMSGRFPQKAAGEFLILVKSLRANANVNGLEEPVIVEAIANQASRPYGRFGRIKRKRTHIKLVAKEQIKKSKKKLEETK